MIIGPGTNFWGNSIFILPSNMTLFEAEFLPHSIKIIPVVFSLSGTFLAIFLYYIFSLKSLYNLKLTNFGTNFYNFFNRKWFVDKIYNEFINQNVLFIGFDGTYRTVDRGFIEYFGPYGLSLFFYNRFFNFSYLQTGLIYHYTFFMLLGIICLITFIGFFNNICFFISPFFILFFFILICFLIIYNKKN
jgi:NADH-ubiquinone oxidoreductase chain 5